MWCRFDGNEWLCNIRCVLLNYYDLGLLQVGLKSFVISIDYRDYMGPSLETWLLVDRFYTWTLIIWSVLWHHLTGISSPRFRRCSVGEEARVLFPRFFLLPSCFTFSMTTPQTFSKMGVSHFQVYPRLTRGCWVSKFLQQGDGYPRIAPGWWTSSFRSWDYC